MKSNSKTKFIFITGGVLSSLGKGLTSASLGSLLKSKGLGVTMQKLDPYLNLDPGTMSPHQHGEVFVTDDGAETDMDLGHYERFLGTPMTRKSSHTAGTIYSAVLDKERSGRFLGRTVQVIPHVTDEIKSAVLSMSSPDLDVVLIEVGGTVGDIEGQPFLEALRQLKHELGKSRSLFMHLTLVPYLGITQELKTKPTQHSVKELRSVGIQPDIIICRSSVPVDAETKSKIALFCDVSQDAVFTAMDVKNIHELPIRLYEQGLERKVSSLLRLGPTPPVVKPWQDLVRKQAELTRKVTIAIVGKYVSLTESYKSLQEALTHGGLANNVKVELQYINAEDLTRNNLDKYLGEAQGILVPGGFGNRGIEGMILAITYARTHKRPFFGICLGLQCAVIELARNVAGLKKADSEEFNLATPNPVIFHMASWFDPKIGMRTERTPKDDLGGSMRLGSYPCQLEPGTKAYQAYRTDLIHERHRHRYEVNPAYVAPLKAAGLVISGQVPLNPLDNPNLPKPTLIEIVELSDQPWFLGCQFHPEFKSTPMKPHPLFSSFIEAALSNDPKPKKAQKSAAPRTAGPSQPKSPKAPKKAAPAKTDKGKAATITAAKDAAPKEKAAKKSPAPKKAPASPKPKDEPKAEPKAEPGPEQKAQ
ncbi:MAG: CTP synthase [Deltaproteobacteria bacterium]|jgi:CTP synthase|nr:CTP synthase [Deltaproteobacteria bacterium]